MIANDPSATRRVVFQYLVPVHVEVEDGLVVCVTVIDETPVCNPTLVEGDAGYLPQAVAAAEDGQPWPSSAVRLLTPSIILQPSPAIAPGFLVSGACHGRLFHRLLVLAGRRHA